jgi:hypothetical protein
MNEFSVNVVQNDDPVIIQVIENNFTVEPQVQSEPIVITVYEGIKGEKGEKGDTGDSIESLTDVNDVELEDLSDGEILVYDSSTQKWRNKFGLRTEKIILTQQNVDDMEISLLKMPHYSESVTLIPVGGIPQVNGIDFDVIDNIISWENLGLQGVLEAGDMVVVHY